MDIVGQLRSQGYSLLQIGFCTFTRAARREASARAAQIFGVDVETLEREGWFRTIHSAVYRLLRVPRAALVNHDLDWLRGVLQEPTLGCATDEDSEDWTSNWSGRSEAQIALSWWDVARNRLMRFSDFYDEMEYRLAGVPALDLHDAVDIIRKYEVAKQKDGRLDFCDLLLRYVGIRMHTHGPEKVDPEGDIPPVPVWIFDEAQDTSPLLDLAARRLSQGCIWLYLLGDREQGIYTWAGADPCAFLRWPVAKEDYLRKSWRCAEKILTLGMKLIRSGDDLSDEIKRLGMSPRCEGGTVLHDDEDNLTRYLRDPRVPTLILARTNDQVGKIQGRLTEAAIPWRSVRTRARFPQEAPLSLATAFSQLERNGTLDGASWRRIIQNVPAKLLQRGTKSFFREAASAEQVRDCSLAGLVPNGATTELVEIIRSGNWVSLLKPAEQTMWQVAQKYPDIAQQPAIQVSTIHGSKGMQAEKVILCTRIGNGPVWRNLKTPEGAEEERRVWYVGATRARDELVLLEGPGKNYEDIYDAL